MQTRKTKIRLVYLHCWNGVILSAKDFKDQFFVSNKWELEECREKPDIVVRGTLFGTRHELFQAKLRYGMQAFIVAFSWECLKQKQLKNFDYSISTLTESKSNFYFMCMNSQYDSIRRDLMINVLEPLLNMKEPNIVNTNRSKPKNNFCIFLYSNNKLYLDGVRSRIQFCKMLTKYKKVDCPGKSLNNTNRLQMVEINNWQYAQTIEFMSDYKFAITFENQSKKGYITEKIWNAYIAGCIPIYMGSPDIAEYFNPKTFINCHDYDNFEQVIDRVREIDNDPALYEEYMSAPIVLENSKLHSMSKKNISKAMDSMLEKVVRHREKWSKIKNKKSYTMWLWIKLFITNLPNLFRGISARVKNKILNFLNFFNYKNIRG